MNKRRMIGWAVGIPMLVVVLILIIVFREPEKEGITRAMAAKSVALTVQSPEELDTWQKEYGASRFPAESLDQWYVTYLDYLYEKGYLSEEETPADEAHAEGELTYGEAARIAGAVSPELEKLIPVTKKNRGEPYPAESWWLFFDSLIQAADAEDGVRLETVLVYGTPENVPEAAAWTAYTNLGILGFSGLSLDHLIDHKVTAYVRGTEMIHVVEDKGQDVEYRNVWLAGGDEKELEVYVGDITRRIPFKKKSKKTEDLVGNLADIRLKDGHVTKVSVKKERITGKVLSVREDAVEIEGYGVVPLDDEAKVLKTYGELKRQGLGEILVGYDMQEFVVARGKICAVLTVREFEAETIRVLLMSDGFKGLYQPSVSLTCAGPVKLIQGDDEEEVNAGEVLEFMPGDERLKEGRIILQPEEGQEITVSSLNRAQGNPSYGGRLELIDTGEGLVLINELYLEDYLKKVVPSEMPSSYEMEALKAQAVCARTYAYMQIQSNTYSRYGAHVDDSTNFQVYNNIQTDARTRSAVEETYGKLLLYDGRPIPAYYFSTSCGTTTDGSVWGGDADRTPYLSSVALQPGREQLELTSNEEFEAFIKNQDYPAYDAEFPLYRWNVTTDTEVLTANIGGVGAVENIQVTERGPGGVAKCLKVIGSDGEKTISGQDAIRKALGDESLTIRRRDGKTVEGWGSLPSGFIAIEDLGTGENGKRSFKIYGGGFGHGAGMSQNGAQGMAKDGIGYEEILKFFYDGISVEEVTG